MTGVREHHEFVWEQAGGRGRAGCSCGWQATGYDRDSSSGMGAWSAHLYAKGLRTRKQIEAVGVRRSEPSL